MMQKNLKEDVLARIDGALEFLPASGENAVAYGYDQLTDKNPIFTNQVPGGYRIIFLATLPPTEQAELLAHELGHLLLQAEGLYAVVMQEGGAEEYLAREMNNVIFHHFIVQRLATEYGMGSGTHLALRKVILTEVDQWIEEHADESIYLYGLGLHLLDLALTGEGEEDLQEKIGQVLERDPRVKRGYELGKEWLVYSNVQISAEEQWKRISTFAKEIGFDPFDLRLRGGLEKVEDEDWD